MPTLPPITAVICTRNRGAAVRTAALSVLANDHPSFELLVVDQSTRGDTEDSLEDLVAEGRIRYVKTDTVGVSRGRNIGLRSATTDVVAFTDDDCEVAPDWLRTMGAVFAESPRTAVVFCTVRAGPHDSARGFIPAYECQGTRYVRTLLDKCTARGMGAGFAVRRRELLELGGFDEELGPGGTFPSCEEGDAAVRALLAGFEICETDRTYVVHHGFRSWEEGRELARRDWFGIGAAYAKPLRAGRWAFAPVPAYELLAKAVWPPAKDLLALKRPRGLSRGVHFLRGFAKGWRKPLDERALVFKA
jgi:GT2 family glycosyltransferase